MSAKPIKIHSLPDEENEIVEIPKAGKDLPQRSDSFATKEELVSLANKLDKVLDAISKNTTNITTSGQPVAPVKIDMATADTLEGNANNTVVPPSYRQTVDEILGKDFGCYVHYNSDDSGFMVSIIVPSDKSNVSREYMELYKADIRSRSLTNGQGLAGVKLWCTQIRRNLERSGVRFVNN